MDILTIHNEAQTAAINAEQAFIAQYGEPMYCGFGWVEVYVDRTNSKQAKELLAAGFKKDYKPRCLTVWNPGGSHTQSMDIKEHGAVAYARTLVQHGIDAHMSSRAD